VSSPTGDERILEVAERVDGLSENEQEAALAALAPSDHEQVVLTMLAHSTMVEELTGALVDALVPETAERYTDALRRLSWRVLRKALGAGAPSEVQASIDQLVAEHPELGEHSETVAVFLLAHRG